MLLALNFEFTKTSRESFVAAWLPTTAVWRTLHTLTHPMRSVPRFRGLCLLVWSCRCPQVKRKRSVRGCFLSYFVTPILDQFRPLQHLIKVEVQTMPLSRKRGRPIWRASQAAVDEALELIRPLSLCQGTNQRKVHTQRVKITAHRTIPIERLYIIITGKPGDGGWVRSSVALRHSQVFSNYNSKRV